VTSCLQHSNQILIWIGKQLSKINLKHVSLMTSGDKNPHQTIHKHARIAENKLDLPFITADSYFELNADVDIMETK